MHFSKCGNGKSTFIILLYSMQVIQQLRQSNLSGIFSSYQNGINMSVTVDTVYHLDILEMICCQKDPIGTEWETSFPII